MLERFVKSIVEKEGKKSVVDIPVDSISVNPYQPRRNFDQKKLDELARSIKEQGVIQPIIVRRFGSGYELVAGERRLRASKLIDLKTIPAIIRQLDDQDMVEIAFIENLQREQLDEMETVEAYNRIMEEQGGSVEAVADRVGKDVDSIKARLWMLQLPQIVKKAVVSKLITLDQARLIAQIASEKKQIDLLEQIYRNKYDLDQTRELIESMPEFHKVKHSHSEVPESEIVYKYDPASLGRIDFCIGMIADIVESIRAAGMQIEVSELMSGKSVDIRLSFPLIREFVGKKEGDKPEGDKYIV
ncbi:MAG TPA: ParB/RepB/Spo0J family partition protein [bacterium]|nr:ParB/RepB/Spo0J family partition protein [bacterium]